MSELLRKADELIEARANCRSGDWSYRNGIIEQGNLHIIVDVDAFDNDMEFAVLAANNAVDVIKGYQDLLGYIIDAVENDKNDHDGMYKIREILDEIKASIPKE